MNTKTECNALPHQHEALFKGTIEENGKRHRQDGITKWVTHITALSVLLSFSP